MSTKILYKSYIRNPHVGIDLWLDVVRRASRQSLQGPACGRHAPLKVPRRWQDSKNACNFNDDTVSLFSRDGSRKWRDDIQNVASTGDTPIFPWTMSVSERVCRISCSMARGIDSSKNQCPDCQLKNRATSFVLNELQAWRWQQRCLPKHQR